MLIFMHHIVLFTPCIALFNCDNLLHMLVDHAEQKSEIQAELVQKEYGGPQAPSCMDTNLAIGSRQASVHLADALVFYFEVLFYVLLDCAISL
jgi:hypothetical protein